MKRLPTAILMATLALLSSCGGQATENVRPAGDTETGEEILADVLALKTAEAEECFDDVLRIIDGPSPYTVWGQRDPATRPAMQIGIQYQRDLYLDGEEKAVANARSRMMELCADRGVGLVEASWRPTNTPY